MARNRKHWLKVAVYTTVIIVGMLMISIVLDSSQDPFIWVLGVGVAFLVADAAASRNSKHQP